MAAVILEVGKGAVVYITNVNVWFLDKNAAGVVPTGDAVGAAAAKPSQFVSKDSSNYS